MDSELIGVICGFPRDDYLLLSELAVNKKHWKNGVGKKLLDAFMKLSDKKIHAGSKDGAIDFYKKMGFKPFLLLQTKIEDFDEMQFKKINAFELKKEGDYLIMKVKTKKATKEEIAGLRKKLPLTHVQYIFTKEKRQN